MKSSTMTLRRIGRSISIAMVWTGLYVSAVCAERPRVSVIVGASAPQLERFAASELCSYLDKLYRVKTEQRSAASPGAQVVFLVGSPRTNPAIRTAAGNSFPSVSEQGIVLRPTRLGGVPAVIVGGGSARATLWAVYELVERWGVRYL